MELNTKKVIGKMDLIDKVLRTFDEKGIAIEGYDETEGRLCLDLSVRPKELLQGLDEIVLDQFNGINSARMKESDCAVTNLLRILDVPKAMDQLLHDIIFYGGPCSEDYPGFCYRFTDQFMRNGIYFVSVFFPCISYKTVESLNED